MNDGRLHGSPFCGRVLSQVLGGLGEGATSRGGHGRRRETGGGGAKEARSRDRPCPGRQVKLGLLGWPDETPSTIPRVGARPLGFARSPRGRLARLQTRQGDMHSRHPALRHPDWFVGSASQSDLLITRPWPPPRRPLWAALSLPLPFSMLGRTDGRARCTTEGAKRGLHWDDAV